MSAERSEKVTFTGGQGVELAARLDLPEGPPKAYALFAHCFTCSKDIFAAPSIPGAPAGPAESLRHPARSRPGKAPRQA